MPKARTSPDIFVIRSLRQSDRAWRIDLIDGPNMPHLGKRDPSLFGTIASLADLQAQLVAFGKLLGVEVQTFASDYEGEILEYIHSRAAAVDGFLVDPGGLATVSQGWPHALLESKKPYVEISFYNTIASNEISVFAPNAIGSVMGLRQYSYHAALLGLVLSLDDDSFLHPEAPDSATVRRGGVPYSFRLTR